MALATVTPSNHKLANLAADTASVPHRRGTVLRTLCDLGRAIAGLDQDIPALGTECCCDGLCESLGTSKESSPSLNTEFQLLQKTVSTIEVCSRGFRGKRSERTL